MKNTWADSIHLPVMTCSSKVCKINVLTPRDVRKAFFRLFVIEIRSGSLHVMSAIPAVMLRTM